MISPHAVCAILVCVEIVGDPIRLPAFASLVGAPPGFCILGVVLTLGGQERQNREREKERKTGQSSPGRRAISALGGQELRNRERERERQRDRESRETGQSSPGRNGSGWALGGLERKLTKSREVLLPEEKGDECPCIATPRPCAVGGGPMRRGWKATIGSPRARARANQITRKHS